MKLTILGLNGPFPGADGAGSGYLLTSADGQTNVLMDCGPGVLGRLNARLALEQLDAVVLSHLHFDHMSDLMSMGYQLDILAARKVRDRNLMVVALSQPEQVAGLFSRARIDWREPEEMDIGSLHFEFLPAVHPVPGVSVRVSEGDKRLVYTGDTNLHPGLDAFCQGADLLLSDAGLLDRAWSEQAPHLSSLKCGQLAVRAGAKALVLTHLMPYVPQEELLREAQMVFPSAQLAQAGGAYTL